MKYLFLHLQEDYHSINLQRVAGSQSECLNTLNKKSGCIPHPTPPIRTKAQSKKAF